MKTNKLLWCAIFALLFGSLQFSRIAIRHRQRLTFVEQRLTSIENWTLTNAVNTLALSMRVNDDRNKLSARLESLEARQPILILPSWPTNQLPYWWPTNIVITNLGNGVIKN